jgi:HK97 family phage portal protein
MLGVRVRGEQRAIQATPWGDWGDGQGPGGQQVTVDGSLSLLAVYGCVRFICEGISTLPIDVFREKADGSREAIAPPLWLTQPTVDLDRIAWLTQILTSLLLAGNAYLRRVYDSQLRLIELVPMNPTQVSVRRDKGMKTYFVNGQPLGAFEVLHIPGVMFPGADVGMSPVEAARQNIMGGLSVEEFAGKFFSQGANLGGVIEDPGELDPEKARETARIWARLHSGNRKAHSVGVLQGGATWKPTGVTNEQAQFLQTRQFTASQIASHMFLIDPTEFGFSGDKGSSLTYANLEQRNARKVQVTFLPWIVRLEAAFSAILAKPRYVKFNVNGLLRGDTKTRFETYQIASAINTAAASVGEPPILTTREMRGFEDLVPYEGPIPTPVAAEAPAAISAGGSDG